MLVASKHSPLIVDREVLTTYSAGMFLVVERDWSEVVDAGQH